MVQFVIPKDASRSNANPFINNWNVHIHVLYYRYLSNVHHEISGLSRGEFMSLAKSRPQIRPHHRPGMARPPRFPLFQMVPVAPLISRSPRIHLPVPELSIDLPHQHYSPTKTNPVPFDPQTSCGAKFASLTDAMSYIARHCRCHHGGFTRNLGRLYLPFCRIWNTEKEAYTIALNLSKKEFETAFHTAQKNVGSH
jgi:hypothetical protein